MVLDLADCKQDNNQIHMVEKLKANESVDGEDHHCSEPLLSPGVGNDDAHDIQFHIRRLSNISPRDDTQMVSLPGN